MKLRLLLTTIVITWVLIGFITYYNNAYAQLPFISQSQPAAVAGEGQSSAPSRSAVTNPQALSSQQLTSQQAEMIQRMTPEQARAAEGYIRGNGRALTPEAMEALKSQPEFKGLKPEDVAKGKEILERKEALGKESEKTLSIKEKRVIGAPDEAPLFERMRKFGKYQDISTTLKPFGYEFFQDSAVRVVTERKDIPVPTQYMVGPGDEVRILLWGRVNAQHSLIVDRNGNITIPQIGPVQVSGMTFEDMSKKLLTQAEQIVGANIDITMGSLKTIPIFVLGDVKRPGAYTIGSFSTITDSLLMAGGPTGIGSMRNVQLKRNGTVVTNFDLYNLLLKGDKSRDLILQAGDVVFVPVSGPLVGIAGNVKRPAIYELKDKTDLNTLFNLAGGIIPTAYTQQIQIERVIKTERQIVVDINDKNLTKSKHFMLQDADLIKVFNIVDRETNAVFLYGNVKKPGKYEFQHGMRIKHLLKDQSEMLPETHLDYALIKRMEPPDFETSLIPVSLKDLFKPGGGKADIELKPMDELYVFSKWFFRDRPYITVEGEIRGGVIEDIETTRMETLSAPYTRNTETHDLGAEDIRGLGLAGSDKRKLDEIRKIGMMDINEMKLSELRTKGIVRVDQKKVDELKKTGIIDLDNLKLSELRKQGILDSLGINDEVLSENKKSFEIALKANMTARDAILAAGGLTKDAYLQEAELYRTDEMTKSVTIVKFNPKKALEGDIGNNIVLKDKDRLVIQSIWGYEYKKTVDIDGEVLNPGTYQCADDMTVKDLIFSAGNILNSAYLGEADVSFHEVEDGQTATINHVKINLRKALENDPEHNLKLKPFSRVLVKRISDWRAEQFVNIMGEVKFPGKYIIKKGEKLTSVIERAGGYTDKAYLRGAFFTRTKLKELQQKTLNESVRRLEKDLMAESTLRLSTALSPEEVAGLQAQQAGTRFLVDSLARTEVTGRMTLRLANLRLMKGSEYDIELDDGDSLYIPKMTNVVNVSGAVMVHGSYTYSDVFDYRDYIDRAGGLTRYADEKNIFVLKVDGSAMKIPGGMFSWNSPRSRWELTAFGEDIKTIEPGDTIVVPEKLQATAWLRSLKDITAVLAQAGIFASSMNYIFK